ncbi:phosphopyruvate hydratase [Candidatus Woesearchaeota archaeon]|nr:phosphopyruvate hydratase [Candidatus Woesearchaeota archaeon]
MSYFNIKKINARQILDSRGNPTVEVDVVTEVWRGRAKVPSGASTGRYEALELRDKEKAFNGKGVEKAISNINKIIAKKLAGIDVRKQSVIDKTLIKLDGTAKKSKLGANAILGVSLACARAGAHCNNLTYWEYLGQLSGNSKPVMPVPFMNILNGGEHADNKLAIQEFMIVPLGKCYSESLRMGAEVYHELKKEILKKYGKGSTGVGDEGGFAPNVSTTKQALDLITKAISDTGYSKKVKIAIDAAASYFYKRGKKPRYLIDGAEFPKEKMIDYYSFLMDVYPIVSIEDPFEENDFASYAKLTRIAKKQKVMVTGDDLTVTNVKRIRKAAKAKACSCLLLKVNQIGTLTEAIAAVKLAQKNKWKVMVSHRSGETEDTFIADFAVGLGNGLIKAGAPCRGERTAKYNELLRIEERLGKNVKYGASVLTGK